MGRAEITKKFDEIVAFSGVERFIDTPVKHYSSGMKVRLAFSVAAHLEPELLLIDEVLAVGDAAFQRKCLGKIGDVVQGGRTVLFVSHNMGAIAQLCQRVLWFENGQVKQTGLPAPVIAAYLESGTARKASWVSPDLPPEDVEAYVKWARIVSLDGRPVEVVEFGTSCKVEMAYDVRSPIRDLAILCRVTDAQGTILWTGWDTDATLWKGQVREPGQYLSACTIPGGLLRPGHYLLSIGALINRVKLLGYHEYALGLQVSEVGYHLNLDRIGVIAPPLAWEVQVLDGKS
jgi:lipopolysaccharide transport system ATP-binding protein